MNDLDLTPRRCPDLLPTRSRVSAALFSREPGCLGDPRTWRWGNCYLVLFVIPHSSSTLEVLMSSAWAVSPSCSTNLPCAPKSARLANTHFSSFHSTTNVVARDRLCVVDCIVAAFSPYKKTILGARFSRGYWCCNLDSIVIFLQSIISRDYTELVTMNLSFEHGRTTIVDRRMMGSCRAVSSHHTLVGFSDQAPLSSKLDRE